MYVVLKSPCFVPVINENYRGCLKEADWFKLIVKGKGEVDTSHFHPRSPHPSLKQKVNPTFSFCS